jgi:hypothetical protein
MNETYKIHWNYKSNSYLAAIPKISEERFMSHGDDLKSNEDVCSSAFRRLAQIIKHDRLKAELQTIL